MSALDAAPIAEEAGGMSFEVDLAPSELFIGSISCGNDRWGSRVVSELSSRAPSACGSPMGYVEVSLSADGVGTQVAESPPVPSLQSPVCGTRSPAGSRFRQCQKALAHASLRPTALIFKTPSPARPAVSSSKDPEQLQELLSQIRAHVVSPLLPLPDVQAVRRRRYKFVPESEKRRSSRLAAKARTKPASAVKRSQQVLMAKMGIAAQEEVISDSHLAQYAQFFQGPMTISQVQALAALFGLTVPVGVDGIVVV